MQRHLPCPATGAGLIAAAVALGSLGLSSCSTAEGSLQWISEGTGTSFGLAVPVPGAGTPVSVLVGGLCQSGEATPSVTSIAFKQADPSMKVRAWATRFRPPNATTSGVDIGDLSASGYDPSSNLVSTPCDARDSGTTDLAIQVESIATGRFTSSDLLIEFRAGSSRGHLNVPFTLVVCVGDPKGTPCKGA